MRVKLSEIGWLQAKSRWTEKGEVTKVVLKENLTNWFI